MPCDRYRVPLHRCWTDREPFESNGAIRTSAPSVQTTSPTYQGFLPPPTKVLRGITLPTRHRGAVENSGLVADARLPGGAVRSQGASETPPWPLRQVWDAAGAFLGGCDGGVRGSPSAVRETPSSGPPRDAELGSGVVGRRSVLT